MNRWVDVAYRQACKKIAREKSERATFCIASITHNGVNSFLKSFSYFQATFFNEKPVFFHYRICTERRRKRGEFRGMNQNRTSCSLMRGPKGQLTSKRLFWCLQLLPKYERKQVDLRYYSSKVKFFRSFFGRIEDTKKSF